MSIGGGLSKARAEGSAEGSGVEASSARRFVEPTAKRPTPLGQRRPIGPRAFLAIAFALIACAAPVRPRSEPSSSTGASVVVRETREFVDVKLRGGFGDSIWALALSDDDRFVAAAAADKTLQIWAIDGKEDLSFKIGGPARELAFTPDSRFVAANSKVSFDVVDVVGKRVSRHFSVPDDVALTLDPRGRYLATSRQIGSVLTVSIQDVVSGAELHRLDVHDARPLEHPVLGIIDEAGEAIGAWTEGVLTVWRRDGRELGRCTPCDGSRAFDRVIASPDLTRVVAFKGGRLSIVDLARDRVVATIDDFERERFDLEEWLTMRIGWNRDGTRAVIARQDRASSDGFVVARLYETQGWRSIARLADDDAHLGSWPRWSMDGTTISLDDPKGERVFDGKTGRRVRTGPRSPIGSSVVRSADGRLLAAVRGAMRGGLIVYDADSSEVRLENSAQGAGIRSIARVPGGLVTLTRDPAELWRWDLESGSVARIPFEPKGDISKILSAPDGRIWVVEEPARLIAVPSGEVIRRLDGVGFVASKDGARVAVQPKDGRIRVYGSERDTPLFEVTCGRGSLGAFEFSASRKFIIAANADATACVFETTTGKEVARRTLDARPQSVAIDDDGHHAVVSTESGVSIWDLRGIEPINALSSLAGASTWVDIAPSGDVVVLRGDLWLMAFDGAGSEIYAGNNERYDVPTAAWISKLGLRAALHRLAVVERLSFSAEMEILDDDTLAIFDSDARLLHLDRHELVTLGGGRIRGQKFFAAWDPFGHVSADPIARSRLVIQLESGAELRGEDAFARFGDPHVLAGLVPR